MHEAAIVAELIALTTKAAPPGARVTRLEVRVGALTGVSPDAMQFYFEALRLDTLGPQAQLCASIEPLRGHCRDCNRAFAVEQAIWCCPGCGHASLVFENGDELDLKNLVVEYDEPDHDRTEDPQEERGHRG